MKQSSEILDTFENDQKTWDFFASIFSKVSERAEDLSTFDGFELNHLSEMAKSGRETLDKVRQRPRLRANPLTASQPLSRITLDSSTPLPSHLTAIYTPESTPLLTPHFYHHNTTPYSTLRSSHLAPVPFLPPHPLPFPSHSCSWET